MLLIEAVSISPHARDWLTSSRRPRILHVFDQACNLINERREVLSLVTREIGNGPFNLVIQEDIFFSDHLHSHSAIAIRADQLDLGDLSVSTDDAKPWSARPDWELLHGKRGDILKQIMSLRVSDSERSNPLTESEIASGGVSIRPSGCSTTALAMTTSITSYQSPSSNSLISALVNTDLQASLTSARRLAGLGNGLTPAGDDFILGALYAAWIIHPLEVAKGIAREISNAAAPLTTSLSAAWLRSAGRGEAGILWHDLLDALLSDDGAAVQRSANAILGIGHSSGADALAGFIGTMQCPRAAPELETGRFPS